jgi:hypothetical protein
MMRQQLRGIAGVLLAAAIAVLIVLGLGLASGLVIHTSFLP